jgi:AraC-like DNA-binding protein
MIIRRESFKLNGKSVVGKVFFKPPFKAAQALQEEARFVSILRGRSKLYVPNNQLNISSSDSFMMKCESFVSIYEPLEDEEPCEVIVFQLFPEILQEVYNDKLPEIFQQKTNIQPQSVEKIKLNEMLKHFLNSISFYFDHPGMVTDELIKIKIRELIQILINSDREGRLLAILGSLFQSNEYEFKDIINAHIFEDLKLDDLAFFTGLSLSSFKRKFKSVYGTSPTRYIKSKRLANAALLLKTTDLRVSDIAYDSGFNDIGYFSKSFHAEYQLSPSDYRKHNQ